MLHGVSCQDANKIIKANYALRYERRVIARVNKEEENVEGHKRKMTKGTIKVFRLIQDRETQSYPRLAWDMFHNI